jgi:hypothetical protein
VESANAFLRAPVNVADAIGPAGDAYAAASETLIRQLRQHLADEEDLIIPLILDRGEEALGVGH